MLDKNRVATYLKASWLPLFSAFGIGLAFPLWRMIVWESPSVYVEVTGIDKSPDPERLKLRNETEFKFLIDASPFSRVTEETVDIERLEGLLKKEEDEIENADNTMRELRENKEELEKGVTLDLRAARRFAEPLSFDTAIRFDRAIFTPRDENRISELRAQLVEGYSIALEKYETEVVKRKKQLEAAKVALAKRTETRESKEARIRIDCAVSNTGRGAISLKPEGLLRVYLGGVNYLDVDLVLEDYDDKADLPPRSSKVLKFVSRPVQEMRDIDQEQVNTYFRQSAPAKLFLVDIKEEIYTSNTVPFAKGLYRQAVYERLRKRAAQARLESGE